MAFPCALLSEAVKCELTLWKSTIPSITTNAFFITGNLQVMLRLLEKNREACIVAHHNKRKPHPNKMPKSYNTLWHQGSFLQAEHCK